ncbi:MAG: SDR family NAD(P)-dependent oxidoreductase [Acidimicrobiales bacterium]
MTPKVIVSGGASGIGAATCEVLARRSFEPVAADLALAPGIEPLDVVDEDSWAELFDRTGPVAGLVNCAGIRTRNMIVDTSVEEFERHLQVNVTGTWIGIREFLRRHEPGAHGAVVNIASVNAVIAVPGQAHYVASKGGVSALTKAAAIEGAPLGVRVNAIAPGPIRTPMTEERLVDPAQVEWLEGRVPLGRVGEAPEMGEVISFLLSEASSYVTGTVLYADGGWVANGA